MYLAVLKPDMTVDYPIACNVAVKTLQGNVFYWFESLFNYKAIVFQGDRLDQATVESFLKEGVIMKNFDHPHVLKLLGVCVPSHENPMVVLPYMSNGDLRSYVKDKKKVHHFLLITRHVLVRLLNLCGCIL